MDNYAAVPLKGRAVPRFGLLEHLGRAWLETDQEAWPHLGMV